MSGVIKGNVSGNGLLKGNVSAILGKDGYSAYEIALINGFVGTEAEWLASLKGNDGEMGVSGVYVGTGEMPDGFNVQVNPDGNADAFVDAVAEEVAAKILGDIQTGSNARIAEVVLFANAWVGAKTPYAQVVSIPTVTKNTQVDLTPSVEQLSIFYEKDLTFVTENDDGVVTVYAIGQKPTNDYTIQATLKEVSA